MARYICDLHIHSRFAQACSKDITIQNLEKWAKIKGIDVLGTGDFTHPEWIKELKKELVKEKDGIFYTATNQPFVLQTEISLVYTEGTGRRIHLVVFAPSFDIVEKITAYLLRHGRIDYDGRPIFKIPAWQFVKELKEISDHIEIIPAHAWTPWFALFGSNCGFDSLEECFHEQKGHIHAIETGLSSDIEMNDRLDQLKGIRFVSFSDSHSFWPWRLGREATIFDMERLSYKNIIEAIRTGKGFWGTIEVDPNYGKYHYDGHRACNVVQSPSETKKTGGICPVCKKELTIGVQYRVDQLADRPQKNNNHSQQFYKLLPLHEILSLMMGSPESSKKVWAEYWNILKAGKNEFDVLMNVPEEELKRVTSPEIAHAIVLVREGKVTFDPPGYDGVYGVAQLPGIKRKEKKERAQKEQEPSGEGTSVAQAKPRGRPRKDAAKPQQGLDAFF